MQGRGLATPTNQPIGGARTYLGHDRVYVACIYLALDVPSHVANVLDIGDRGAAKFHYEAGHNGFADFSVLSRGALCFWAEPACEKARIHNGGGCMAATAPLES